MQHNEYIKNFDIDEHNVLNRGHLRLNGFNDKKIVSDTRFRIVEALRNAGLF